VVRTELCQGTSVLPLEVYLVAAETLVRELGICTMHFRNPCALFFLELRPMSGKGKIEGWHMPTGTRHPENTRQLRPGRDT
jgi:hypothetical protein